MWLAPSHSHTLNKGSTMTTISGYCDPRFQRVADIFEDNFIQGLDVGASVSLICDNEVLIDLWGGWFDEEKTTPWNEDTLVPVFSTSKTMVALCALILIDRGQLDPFSPVAHYWPEFAANGKEKIQVRHLMSHTSGLSGWDQPVTVDDVFGWTRGIEMLAQQSPWWEPGTASGYHLVSYNHLVGEIISRVSGMSPPEFFAQELKQRFDLDYHFGVSPDIANRVSRMIPPKDPAFDFSSVTPDSVASKTFLGPWFGGTAGSPEYLAREVTMNGITNARNIARAQAVVSHGGCFDGQQLLSENTINLIFEKQSSGVDLVLGVPVDFGIGYALPRADWGDIPVGRNCWWSGMGGSRIVNFLDHKATLGYAMNQIGGGLVGDIRTSRLIEAVSDALKK